MKIAVAQIQPVKGDIVRNVTMHRRFSEAAATHKAQLIVFPELSLTGYEPSLARDLATTAEDSRLRELQYVCDRYSISITAGLPTMNERGVLISMIIFQPGMARKTYSKQLLHVDERPFFTSGTEDVSFRVAGKNVVPAICYESLRAEHALKAAAQKADIYLSSVAKSSHGIEKARVHYPAVASAHKMMVVMSNSVGFCDNFVAAGCSAAWSLHGTQLGQLGEQDAGMLITDTENNTIIALDKRFSELKNEVA